MQKKKVKKKKEECTVDYCCNPQCIWVWGNSDFPTPFSYMYKCIQKNYVGKHRRNPQYFKEKITK